MDDTQISAMKKIEGEVERLSQRDPKSISVDELGKTEDSIWALFDTLSEVDRRICALGFWENRYSVDDFCPIAAEFVRRGYPDKTRQALERQ